MPAMRRHAARVAFVAARFGRTRAGIGDRRQHVEREHAFRERRVLVAASSAAASAATRCQRAAPRILPTRSMNSRCGDSPLRWVIAKNGMPWKSTLSIPGSASNSRSKNRWPASCAPRPVAAPARKNPKDFACGRGRRRRVVVGRPARVPAGVDGDAIASIIATQTAPYRQLGMLLAQPLLTMRTAEPRRRRG